MAILNLETADEKGSISCWGWEKKIHRMRRMRMMHAESQRKSQLGPILAIYKEQSSRVFAPNSPLRKRVVAFAQQRIEKLTSTHIKNIALKAKRVSLEKCTQNGKNIPAITIQFSISFMG